MRSFEGTFTVEGQRMRVTDPCYDREQGVVVAAKSGVWYAFIRRVDEGAVWGGMRVCELSVVHESVLASVPVPEKGYLYSNLKYVRGDADVDAGLCGFFDDARYKQNGLADDHPRGWHGVCDSLFDGVTSTVDCKLWEDKGVFSSSGFGDGNYPVWCDARTNNELATMLSVVYIYPTSSEEEQSGDLSKYEYEEEEARRLASQD